MLDKISKPDPIDVHVGARLKMRRLLIGMSQSTLGNGLELTFQQIQKYERGANRIGSSRLYRISKILGVPVAFFFDELPEEVTKKALPLGGTHDAPDSDSMARRETLEMVRAYYDITDRKTRKRVFELVKSLAK